MKKKMTAIYALVFLSVVLTAVLMMFMPDTVPVHYNIAGEVDRFGSKYENLVFPLVTVLMGVLFICVSKSERKKGSESNEKVLLNTGICILTFFNVLLVYTMVKGIIYNPSQPESTGFEIGKFAAIGIGVLLIVLGNIMPKARRNSMFGLRTKWSKSSDEVWQKSQRFGGIASVVTGLISVVVSIFVPGEVSVIVLLCLAFLWVILCAAMSRKYYYELKK